MAKSEFKEWFVQQFGHRTSGHLAGKSDSELEQAIAIGNDARAELERRKLWDNRSSAALYGWTARQDKLKKGTTT